MRRRFPFLLTVMTPLCFSLVAMQAHAQSPSSSAGARAVSDPVISATFTDAKGAKTIVQAITYHKNVGGQSYYVNVDSHHEFDWPYIPIDTGNFIIKLPLAAIRTLSVAEEEPGKWDKHYRVTALLADGQSRFSGEMTVVTAGGGDSNRLGGFPDSDSLVGKTDFGSFSINFVDIHSVDFASQQTPAAPTKSAIPTTGVGGTLLLADGSTLEMKNIFPVANQYNENDVPQGEVPVAQFQLSSEGGFKTKISPATLKSIRFLPKSSGEQTPDAPEIDVESTSGQQLRGVIGDQQANAFGLGGTALLGGNEYEIIVPFTTKAKQLIIHNN